MMLKERTIGGLHQALIPRVRSLELQGGLPILDMGCGTGAWLARLADLGFQNLYGVDQDLSGVRFRGASYQPLDLNEAALPCFGVRQFALISAIEVIEHLANPGNFFHLVSRLLAPNGRLLLTTPNIHSVVCRLRFLLNGRLKQFDDKGDQTHIYPVLVTALSRLLPRYHLGVVDAWPFPEDGASPTTVSYGLRIGAQILRRFVPEVVSGDVLCMVLQLQC